MLAHLSSLAPFQTDYHPAGSKTQPPFAIPQSLVPSSPFLDSLSKLSRRTRTAHQAPSSFLVSSFDPARPEGAPTSPLEELSWTGASVVWARGGTVHRTYTFASQGQNVTQALFAYFPVPSEPSSPVASTSATRTDDATFSPFRRPPPPAWTDDPLALPIHPTPSLPSAPAVLERHLVIFLSDIAFAYSPSGGSVPFQLPFHLRRAWAMDKGILLERAEEGGESGQAEMATLYSLLDPSEEMKVVSTTLSLSRLFPSSPTSPNSHLSSAALPTRPIATDPTEPIQDLQDRIVFVSSRTDGSEPVLISANASKGKIGIWTYAQLEDALDEPASATTDKGKGKEKASAKPLPALGAGDRSLSSGKRKRSSFANASSASISLGDRDRLQRRPSAVGGAGIGAGAGSISLAVGAANGVTEETDLLEALGESMGAGVKRTASAMSALAAVDRRGSVTRNELSITMDRMALGVGMLGEMDREATLFVLEHEETRMVSDVLLSKVWEIDLAQGGSSVFEGITTHTFDSRATSPTSLPSSTLAIHLPSSSNLLLLNLSRSPEGSLLVAPLTQIAATFATPILASRARVLDLLVHEPSGNWGIVTAAGRADRVGGPPIPEGRTLIRAEGDGSREVVLTLDDGSRHTTTAPPFPTDLALRCLHTLSLLLPADDFASFLRTTTQWKQSVAGSSDMDAIAGVLTSLFLGTAPEPSPEKPWEHFVRATADKAARDPLLANLRSSGATQAAPGAATMAPTDRKYLETIVWGFHLLAEDCKLVAEMHQDHSTLVSLLFPLAAALGLVNWFDSYRRISGGSPVVLPSGPPHSPSNLPPHPPNILNHLASLLSGRITSSWLPPHDLAAQLDFSASSFYGAVDPCRTTADILEIYERLSPRLHASESPSLRAQNAVLEMDRRGWTIERLEKVAFGVALPLREAIRLCQLEAPESWPRSAYELVRRPDLAKQIGGDRREEASPLPLVSPLAAGPAKGSESKEAGHVPKATRFNEDRRLEEVARMLQYSEPVTIGAGDRSLDQLTPQVQQSILTALSSRTLALPIGSAMFNYGSRIRPAAEAVSIPRINTSARILPMPSPVALVDKDHRDIPGTPDRLEWPEFHSGVAAALQLHSGSSSFDSSQISFNKPAELDARHAGFLLGLGLVGHISAMVFNQAYEYLKMKHDPTSIGLLLGLAVTYVGTGDAKVTSLLSVHLAALHPSNSSLLNVSGITQAAGLVGIGLLYLGTQRRTLADIMIRELCGIKVTSIEDPTACREAYALSAGFAFGMIMLGKGKEASATSGEVGLLRTFRALILGESNHPLPGAAPSLNVTDVNITSSAATIAVGLMFLRTERQDVADILEIPDTARRLDYVRFDLLLLRTLARSMIMWESVATSKAWVESHVPPFINTALLSRGPAKGIDADLDIARWNIIAGACFAMGLKFAGTAVAEAHATLIHYLDRLTRAAYVKASTVQGKSKRHAIRCCLSVVAVSLSMVMAGTGEINVLRRLRVAHGHFSEGVTYGTHLASHMALGLLFVGSGHYTLGTSNSAIAALLLAFYPSFPSSPTENRAHLQAYRHLWTLAVEPRCLQARDVDTNEPAFLPIRLRLIEQGNTVRAKQLVAPTLIPEIRLIDTIQIDSPRYWGFSLHLASNSQHLASFLHDGTIYVKRRTGHLSYAQDPRGIRSIFTRSKSETGSAVFDFGETARMLAPSAAGLRDFVSAFSDDAESIAAVKYLCHPPGSKEAPTAFEAFCASVLLECLTRDKRDTIGVYHAMFHAHSQLSSSTLSPLALLAAEQLRFVVDFYVKGTCKTLLGKTKIKATAGPREPLIQSAFIEHVALKTRERSRSLLVDPLFAVALRSYLVSGEWPADSSASRALAMCLLLHGAPSASSLAQLREKAQEVLGLEKAGEGNATEAVKLLMRGTAMAVEAAGGRGWSREFGDLAVEIWTGRQ